VTERGESIGAKLDAIRADQMLVREQLAALHERLRAYDQSIERFYADRMQPLEKATQANTDSRQQQAGALRLAVVFLGIAGASILGVGGWMVRTTLVLEERQEATTAQIRELDRTVTQLRQALGRGER
jgi:prefoldin subunit 5